MNNVFYGAWLYYVLIVATGGFFIVNLFLAVIFDSFSSNAEKEKEVRSAACSQARAP